MKLLEPVDSYPEKYWLSYDHGSSIDHLSFQECKLISGSDLSVRLSLNKKVGLSAFRKFDYLFSDGPDIVTSRLVDIFVAMGLESEIQFIPACVAINGDLYNDYYAVNYLMSESAFDMERCVYKPLIKSLPDGPKRFSKIVLQDIEPTHSIFRALESMSRIVVSDRAAESLQNKSVIGICFVEVRSDM